MSEYDYKLKTSIETFNLIPLFAPDLSSSPPGPYHQDAYVPKQEEKFKYPPILPPHLLQVILNKDTGISVSLEVLFFLLSYYSIVTKYDNTLIDKS